MKKGNLSSVTLAVSLVFGGNTIAANPCIDKSRDFEESETYSVDGVDTVRSKRADQLDDKNRSRGNADFTKHE